MGPAKKYLATKEGKCIICHGTIRLNDEIRFIKNESGTRRAHVVGKCPPHVTTREDAKPAIPTHSNGPIHKMDPKPGPVMTPRVDIHTLGQTISRLTLELMEVRTQIQTLEIQQALDEAQGRG